MHDVYVAVLPQFRSSWHDATLIICAVLPCIMHGFASLAQALYLDTDALGASSEACRAHAHNTVMILFQRCMGCTLAPSRSWAAILSQGYCNRWQTHQSLCGFLLFLVLWCLKVNPPPHPAPTQCRSLVQYNISPSAEDPAETYLRNTLSCCHMTERLCVCVPCCSAHLPVRRLTQGLQGALQRPDLQHRCSSPADDRRAVPSARHSSHQGDQGEGQGGNQPQVGQPEQLPEADLWRCHSAGV